MSLHWSTHQLTEYFAAVSASADEDTAIQVAVERAVEALEGEVGAATCGGGVRGLLGLLPPVPASTLAAIAGSAPVVELPGMGPAHAGYASLGSGIGGDLVVARIEDAFTVEERQMLRGMAQVLGLALRNLRTLAVERSLRQERERQAEQRLELLGELRARQALLETLLAIQRAISHREPLPSVLDAVTEGASNLLGQAVVVLVLADPADPDGLIMASTHRWSEDGGAAAVLAGAAGSMATDQVLRPPGGGGDRLLAAPVHVSGTIGGSLVAILTEPPGADDERVNLIAAFAQQISMALTDAHTVEAMRQAYRDPLTGLPNRKLFLERLDQALAGRRTGPVTILFIDLDRFKSVNDSLGHRAGDDLLIQVGDRIHRSLRAGDIAARLGGDEFAVLLDGVCVEDGLRVAERIATDIAEPFQIAGRTASIGSSIGITTLHQADRTSAAELLGNADVAMYRAKKNGSGQAVVYEPYMHDDVLRRLDLEADLQHALAGGQFRLNFQPLIRLDTGGFVAVEALLRWNHPTRGNVPPTVFIPIAEEIGLIDDIGRWVLREAARQVCDWRKVAPYLVVNVNVSARQLTARRFVDDVADALAAAGIPGHALTLELTETALMTDPATALRQLRSLKDAGVHLAVDDFGTGYSSLAQLRRFPVDQVKIDRSFVAEMDESPEDRAVVRAIIDLSRALRLDVVAEGIEDAAQLRALLRMGCRFGQGYHLYRPMEPSDLGESLRHARTGAAGQRAPVLTTTGDDGTPTGPGQRH